MEDREGAAEGGEGGEQGHHLYQHSLQVRPYSRHITTQKLDYSILRGAKGRLDLEKSSPSLAYGHEASQGFCCLCW